MKRGRVSRNGDGDVTRPGAALLGFTAVQIFSGVAAYSVRAAAAGDPQSVPLTVWTTVAHDGARSAYIGGGDCAGDNAGGWEIYVPVGRFSSFFRRS